MLSLRVEDFGADFVTVVRTKGGRMLKVPITSELRSELLARAHPSGFVFGQDRYDGKPPTQSAVTVAFGRLLRKIELPGVTHHVLRHTGASAMVSAGASLRVVPEIGGWTSLRMLERYAHPSGEEMQRAVRVLSDQTTGTSTSRAIRNEDCETRKRVVGFEDQAGVPNGIRTRVLALKGLCPGPLDDGDVRITFAGEPRASGWRLGGHDAIEQRRCAQHPV